MGYKLSPIGEDIVRRGGRDDASDDDRLVLELMKRAPGMSKEEYQTCFVALRMEYGEDAMYAVEHGYVKFEERPGGTRDGNGEAQ